MVSIHIAPLRSRQSVSWWNMLSLHAWHYSTFGLLTVCIGCILYDCCCMNFIIIVARVLFVVAIGVVTVFWQSMLLFRMFTVISYS